MGVLQTQHVHGSDLTFFVSDASFEIDGNGTLRTSRVLDREDQDLHEFTVTVSDDGSPSLSVETTVTVIVDLSLIHI